MIPIVRFSSHEAEGAVGSRRCDFKYVRRWSIHKVLHGAEIGGFSFLLTGWWGGACPPKSGKWGGWTNGAEKKKQKKKGVAQLLDARLEGGSTPDSYHRIVGFAC